MNERVNFYFRPRREIDEKHRSECATAIYPLDEVDRQRQNCHSHLIEGNSCPKNLIRIGSLCIRKRTVTSRKPFEKQGEHRCRRTCTNIERCFQNVECILSHVFEGLEYSPDSILRRLHDRGTDDVL